MKTPADIPKKYTKLLSTDGNGLWQFTWRSTVYVFLDFSEAVRTLSNLVRVGKIKEVIHK